MTMTIKMLVMLLSTMLFGLPLRGAQTTAVAKQAAVNANAAADGKSSPASAHSAAAAAAVAARGNSSSTAAAKDSKQASLSSTQPLLIYNKAPSKDYVRAVIADERSIVLRLSGYATYECEFFNFTDNLLKKRDIVSFKTKIFALSNNFVACEERLRAVTLGALTADYKLIEDHTVRRPDKNPIAAATDGASMVTTWDDNVLVFSNKNERQELKFDCSLSNVVVHGNCVVVEGLSSDAQGAVTSRALYVCEKQNNDFKRKEIFTLPHNQVKCEVYLNNKHLFIHCGRNVAAFMYDSSNSKWLPGDSWSASDEAWGNCEALALDKDCLALCSKGAVHIYRFAHNRWHIKESLARAISYNPIVMALNNTRLILAGLESSLLYTIKTDAAQDEQACQIAAQNQQPPQEPPNTVLTTIKSLPAAAVQSMMGGGSSSSSSSSFSASSAQPAKK